MKILFVAFEFPPEAGPGIQRPLKFAKYLPEFGITPVVIAPEFLPSPDAVEIPVDLKQLKEVPEDLIVERVPCAALSRGSRHPLRQWSRKFFSLGGARGALWAPFLELHLPEIVHRHRPEAMYVTMPPFSLSTVCADLAARFKLPTVLDFRDAWSQSQMGPYATYVHYRLTLAQERQCVARAGAIACSTEQIRQELLRLHPKESGEKLVTITSGYDAEMSDWSLQERKREVADVYTIGYVGSFYYDPENRNAMMSSWWKKPPHRMLQYASRREDWLYRSPIFFFRAVAELLQSRPELRNRLRIRFVGHKPAWLDGQIQSCGLTDIVEHLGVLTRDASLRFQAECDSLLVTSSKVIGGEDYSIAGKTFEYFSARKPILGFVCPGAQKDLLERSGMAVLCDPDSPHESAAKLGSLVDGSLTPCPNASFLNSLHRRELAGKLAQVIHSLC